MGWVYIRLALARNGGNPVRHRLGLGGIERGRFASLSHRGAHLPARCLRCLNGFRGLDALRRLNHLRCLNHFWCLNGALRLNGFRGQDGLCPNRLGCDRLRRTRLGPDCLRVSPLRCRRRNGRLRWRHVAGEPNPLGWRAPGEGFLGWRFPRWRFLGRDSVSGSLLGRDFLNGDFVRRNLV